MNKSTSLLLLTSTVLLLGLSACNQEPEKPLTREEKIVAQDEQVRELLDRAKDLNKPIIETDPDATANVEDEIGPNLEAMVFDGSSEESFQAGLEEFQQIANPAEISALNSALQFLKVYDLSARGNLPRLYQELDGNTPRQIIERAKLIRSK